MSQAVLARQVIKDTLGQPIAVLLPIEEYALVRPILESREQELAGKVHEMELAARDPLFLADLRETMAAFEVADAEWWEHSA
ncbi:MAG: hypothetical protein FJ011_06785 [Chloroflexi bacterium]|nr:hypothetical protein [Chloroflexota bacterium]